ncbi:MAG: GyrI-like domain-containing protein [Gallionella sp.]|nr:GyrI-like domain-containing protein [Gallionella sp.]
MEKIDLKKELKPLYQPSAKEVVRVVVPPMGYLMVDGKGDPNNSQEFADAITAVYSVAYTLKFMVKKGATAVDYGVMPLEALWWADDMSKFSSADKSNWLWTVLVAQPAFITKAMVEAALADVKKRKDPVALPKLRFETFDEGVCAQLMHVGPFSEEGPNIERVHRFIEASGSKRRGKHHEIYLSDLRKADPAKWKTIIRQPME